MNLVNPVTLLQPGIQPLESTIEVVTKLLQKVDCPRDEVIDEGHQTFCLKALNLCVVKLFEDAGGVVVGVFFSHAEVVEGEGTLCMYSRLVRRK